MKCKDRLCIYRKPKRIISSLNPLESKNIRTILIGLKSMVKLVPYRRGKGRRRSKAMSDRLITETINQCRKWSKTFYSSITTLNLLTTRKASQNNSTQSTSSRSRVTQRTMRLTSSLPIVKEAKINQPYLRSYPFLLHSTRPSRVH